MINNYLKIAWRNLWRNKGYSAINIGGLAIGMAVAMLIGLWIWDELSFNKHHNNYNKIAQVKQHQTFNGKIETWPALPLPMGDELRNSYGNNFKHVVMSSWPEQHFLTVGDNKIPKVGNFMEETAPELLSLNMLKGTRDGLKDPSSILISSSTAKVFFGDADPMGKIIKIDNNLLVKVTGVYEDLSLNSDFNTTQFITTWKQKEILIPWMKTLENPWGMNGFLVFVQLADNADMDHVSAQIKNSKLKKIKQDELKYKPEIFLHPMSKWHLYEEFKNGKNTGGRIEFVWLFGVIGIFVLLLACINFMNLSTARSEKRAKEVGVRKAIGSNRAQLINQFFSESLLYAAVAFTISIIIVLLILPFFNEVAGKEMAILWSSPFFWILGLGFAAITGLIAGSYPAFYLSSFQAVKVLKGTFRLGRFAATPRKVLVVMQFSVSLILIIGTIIVFRQIQFAKDRPTGYNRDGLIMMQMFTADIHTHFQAFKNELKNTGAVTEIAESSGPLTSVWSSSGGFEWKDKDPSLAVDFPTINVSHEYGKTVGWQFKEGRDFSKEFATDSAGFVVNETAIKFMGLKNPVGETITWDGRPFKIIGVIKDMIMQSPYESARPTVYTIVPGDNSFVILNLSKKQTYSDALDKIKTVFSKYAPHAPFDYKFVDEEYAKKFGDEERIGKLATFFAILAIFISCLGLFGLALFVAEQRTKEIGVRKVLGASVANLWQMLSKDFVVLIIISCAIAAPVAWYSMHQWLQKYEYRTGISWWIFVVAIAGALLITLLTVSFQAIKAAIANPVKSLRTE